MRKSILPFAITLLFGILLSIMAGCGTQREKQKVIFHVQQGKNRTAYLEEVPFAGEQKKILDSAKIKTGDERIEFYIETTEERVFRLKVSNSPVAINFINDVPELEVSVSVLNPKDYSFKGSPANESLNRFLGQQEILARKGRELEEKFTSLKEDTDSSSALHKRLDSIQHLFFENYRHYSDTVKSPAAFLLVYNHVDFGKDHDSLKSFILNAAKRFPNHSRIQLLKDRTLAYLKIFEEEYETGQVLPDIVLPAENGLNFSTASLQGKYYLLNFWSSWCGICFPYNEEIKKAKSILPSSRFEAVSIAIDSEKEQWKTMINNQDLDWVQLIDEKMWQGPAVQTYKIDSIPFNFLVGPDGKIIKKAIPADSLFTCLKNYIK